MLPKSVSAHLFSQERMENIHRLNSKNEIMLMENNFASIAHDINCHDDKSFLSLETRQKAAYFFHEDQVSVVQGLNYMTYHGLRNIFMNTWYARTTNLCINSWDSLWIDFETNGQLHRIPQNHGLVWRPRAADSRQWLIPVGVEPCHASPGEYLHTYYELQNSFAPINLWLHTFAPYWMLC